MMDDKEAVSPIISMILLITIVLVVTAAILQWATPILQRSQNEANYGAVLGYFNALDSTFEDVVNMGEGASRTVDVSVGAGNIYISEIMNETWIVSYNFEGEQRVNFSGLDDGDNKVTIKPSAGINVTVYFPEDGDIGVPHYPTSTVGDEFSFARDLIGTVYIRVNTT
ncbi:hypothetical protein FP804_00070, partial [archaeon]|nr:hypothetical protein [archaeon]